MPSRSPPAPDSALYDDQTDLYALAFSYRDVTAEVAQLATWADRYARRPIGRVLELAAGPADHAIAFAQRGLEAAALDLAAGMCERAEAMATAVGVQLRTYCANMIGFELPTPVDLAFVLINSLAHVHTLDDLIAHFGAVGRALAPGGVYIVEMAHPSDFLGRAGRATGVSTPWTVERDGAVLRAQWGRADDPYDPVAQLFRASVDLTLRAGDRHERVRTSVVMRDWTLDEIRAAARLAGGQLEPVACFGDFSEADVSAPDAWRAIFVFRRVAS